MIQPSKPANYEPRHAEFLHALAYARTEREFADCYLYGVDLWGLPAEWCRGCVTFARKVLNWSRKERKGEA